MRKSFQILMTLLLAVACCCACASAEEKAYTAACAMLDGAEYSNAIDAFTDLGEYKDSSDKIILANYKFACAKEDRGEYQSAIDMFTALADYLDSAEHILSCRYALALKSKEAGDYTAAYSAFLALGDYSDSAKQAEDVYALIQESIIAKYNDKSVKGIKQYMFFGTWVNQVTGELVTLNMSNKCRIMKELTLTARLSEYNVYGWKYENGNITINDAKGNAVQSYILTYYDTNTLTVYDKTNFTELRFKRNTKHTVNAELDAGLVFGMSGYAVKRHETATLEKESNECIQYDVIITDGDNTYQGMRTYYFDAKNRLYKIAVTLNAPETNTAEQNYAELSACINHAFYNVSCADISNKERVNFAGGSYMEVCKDIKGITITLWATGSGGMIWITSDAYSG